MNTTGRAENSVTGCTGIQEGKKRMGRYILNRQFWLRGWHGLPYGIYDTKMKRALFVDEESYQVIMKCDAEQEIDPDSLSERQKRLLAEMTRDHIVSKAGPYDFLGREQAYTAYPARYREEVHWSITGACNLKCRHCFMSAPEAKHGEPSLDELRNIADQLKECGYFNVSLTGGEPLIRKDLPEFLDLLKERGITVSTIFSNGWLISESLLDMLEEKGFHPSFQLSFDGVGWHDFLRGVYGAEARTARALELLQKRRIPVTVSMCMHRKNAHVIRDSISFLAKLGVHSVKLSQMMELGAWADPDLEPLKLTGEEQYSIYERYIPQYFEDDAPTALILGGTFFYFPGSSDYGMNFVRHCSKEKEGKTLTCAVLGKTFYIGADGMVAPCQGMADCEFAKNFPSLKDASLKEILTDSAYVNLSYATVKEVHEGNEDCRECPYTDRCTGGCRNSALISGNHYYGSDPEACYFFRSGWDKRIDAAARPALEAYLNRHPEYRGKEPASGQNVCL